jgi:hypothetical protein
VEEDRRRNDTKSVIVVCCGWGGMAFFHSTSSWVMMWHADTHFDSLELHGREEQQQHKERAQPKMTRALLSSQASSGISSIHPNAIGAPSLGYWYWYCSCGSCRKRKHGLANIPWRMLTVCIRWWQLFLVQRVQAAMLAQRKLVGVRS